HAAHQSLAQRAQAAQCVPASSKYAAWPADGRHYLPISDKITLASRLQLGNLRPDGADETLVPFGKRYFLGGATTIRGRGRYEVSPLSADGFPIGADSILPFTEELPAPACGNLGGVMCRDGGYV